jgi:hypothetical protein
MKYVTKKKNRRSSWKILVREERSEIYSWFDEECQIILEDKEYLQRNV